MNDRDDELAAIVAGDADAFGRWLAGGESRIRASIASFASQVDTEAMLQEALLRVWQVAPSHEPDGRPESLLRLAVRIARNLCIDEMRRARFDLLDAAALERAANADIVVPPRASSDPLLRSTLARCRDELRGKPADVLALRLEGGGIESDEVLASRLGMRLNTFLQNFTRARKLMAACLERHHVDLAAELT